MSERRMDEAHCVPSSPSAGNGSARRTTASSVRSRVTAFRRPTSSASGVTLSPPRGPPLPPRHSSAHLPRCPDESPGQAQDGGTGSVRFPRLRPLQSGRVAFQRAGGAAGAARGNYDVAGRGLAFGLGSAAGARTARSDRPRSDGGLLGINPTRSATVRSSRSAMSARCRSSPSPSCPASPSVRGSGR